MNSRVKAIFSHTGDGVDAIALVNSTEPHLDLCFFYATGLASGVFEGSMALLRRRGALEVVVPLLEEGIARAARLNVTTYTTREEKPKVWARKLRGVETLGFNASEITHRAFLELKSAARRARLVDVGPALREARLVKDAAELRAMRRAADIASRALEEVVESMAPGRREHEVAADLNYAMQRRGASGPSFTTIVASGPNAALPHHTPGDRRLRRGDFVVMDFGASYQRYASDITRTVVVGRARREHREVYGTVHRAQEEARSVAREGVLGRDVDRVAREIIDSSPYRGRFIHSVGHSLGLAVHDGAVLNSTSDLVLKRNMVFTVEPGIYLPGKGGVRIEDDVVVRAKGGPEVMTSATRELLEVG